MSYFESQIDDLVYPYGNPRRIGVVESVGSRPSAAPGDPWRMVTVRFPDGSRQTEENHMWQSFDGLIADHERKLQTHRERRDQARRDLGL